MSKKCTEWEFPDLSGPEIDRNHKIKKNVNGIGDFIDIFCFFVNESDSGILHAPLVSKQHRIESEPIKAGEGDGLL